GACVTPTDGGGSWVGVFPTTGADIRAWGASTSAADNTTAFNNADLWANAQGGGTVWVPAGVWIVSCTTPWTVHSYVRYRGVGESASIVRLCANSTTDLLQTVYVTTMIPTVASSSSVSISNSGTKSFTIPSGGTNFTVGQPVQAVEANNNANYMTGTITSATSTSISFSALRS